MSKRSRHSKRASQSISSIGHAMAIMDDMFPESDDDDITVPDKLDTLQEAEETEVMDAVTPLPHDQGTTPITISEDGNTTPIVLRAPTAMTFRLDDNDLYDLVAEVDKADAEYQKTYNDHHIDVKYNEDDSEAEDDIAPLTPTIPPRNPRQRTLSKVKSHEKEIVAEILERLKVAMTFLLHENSPLHANSNDNNKMNWFYEYNDHMDDDVDLEIYAAKVNLLYSNMYTRKHYMIHKTWSKWLRYAEDVEKNQSIDTKQLLNESHIFIDQQHAYLEDMADEFVLSKAMFKKTTHSLLQSFATRHTTQQEAIITIASNRRSRKLSIGDTRFDPKRHAGFDLSVMHAADVLPTIHDRDSMKQWIDKYKRDRRSKSWINCCRREYIEDAGQKELDVTSPMTTWSWENVVAFMEASEELKHFASVFWQYRINGLELCKMGGEQMELLVECSMLNNHNVLEKDLDTLKNKQKNRWELTRDAQKYVYYKDKVRVQSHVIARYHFAIDVLHDVIYGVLENDDAEFKEFYQDFGLIADLLQILRAQAIDGSKKYWKMDVHFFDKIDNYLAVLICDDLVLQMYQKCYCDFLVPPDKPPSDNVNRLMARNDRLKRQRSTHDESSKNITHNSTQNTNSIQNIASQLNVIGGVSSDVTIRRKCSQTCAERFCCAFVSASFDTIYIPLLCLTVISLLCTSLFIIIWFYSHGLLETIDAMHIARDALGERIHNYIVDEFWMPQMLMSMAIGSLYNGDLDINASISNGSYDAQFIAFSDMEGTEFISGLGLYNSEDNTLLMGYRSNNTHDTHMRIFNFNGTCVMDTAYNDVDDVEMDCDYDPLQQPWYSLAIDNMNKAIWTEPYVFTQGYFGMTLVTAMEFDDTLIIFLCEIRLDIFKDIALLQTTLPPGTVAMITTSDLHIIGSSADALYLTDDDEIDDALIVSTLDYMKQYTVSELSDSKHHRTMFDEDEGYTASVFPFPMVYVNFIPTMGINGSVQLIQGFALNNTDDYQYGYVLIVNDDTYLYALDLAFLISWIVLGFVLITSTSLICVNMKYYNTSAAALSSNTLRLQWLSSAQKRISEENPKLTPMMGPIHNGYSTVEMSKPTQKEESAYSAVSFTITDTLNKGTRAAAGIIQKPQKNKMKVGDRVSTKDGTHGIITHMTDLLEDDSFPLIGLQLDDGRTVFTNKSNIIHQDITLEAIHEDEQKRSSYKAVRTSRHQVQNSNSSSKWEKARSYSIERKQQQEQQQEQEQEQEKEEKKKEKKNKECFHLCQGQLIAASFLQNMVVVIFLIGLWVALPMSIKSDLAENILAKHEWGSVKDEVMELYSKAELVLALYKDRFERASFDIDNDEERDRFLSNIMQSFVTSDSAYTFHYTYLGTPDGRFLGVGWQQETSPILRTGIRNANTEFVLTEYTLSDDATYDVETDAAYSQISVYDPRCRVWYQNAMKYTFNGTYSQAFPSNDMYNTSFEAFVTDQRIVASSTICEKSRTLYASLFNISLSDNTEEIVSSAHHEYYSYDATNDTTDGVAYTLVWSRYVFFSLGQIGLTASAAIQDAVTGDLFGVVGIDFTLGQLSGQLYATIEQDLIDGNQDWFAWIYDASIDAPEMIASSEGHILVDAESNIEGCISIGDSSIGDDAKVPYYATSHPVDRIRIASIEINVTGIDELTKYTNSSISIGVPIEFPAVEAGRIQYFPGGEASIDWIVAKTINTETDSTVDSIQVTFFVSFTILAMTALLMKEFDFIDAHREEEDEFNEFIDKKDANYYYRLMLKMRGIVLGSANVAWKLQLGHNNLNLITTQTAAQFMAFRANEHIAATNENELKFIECAWESALQSEFKRSRNKKMRLKFFRFVESNLYGMMNQLFLCLHLMTSLFEPSTPRELRRDGLKQWVLITIAVCIVMEWVDVLLIIYRRYIEFSIAEPFLTQLYEINYGAKHKYTALIASSQSMDKLNKRLYLVFFGPRSAIFLIHCTLNGLILFDFITRISSRTGYLSYYLPVLPFLLLIRNETVLKFSKNFIFAVLYAKDVLFSYMCFILIFAVLAMSLFRSVVNADDFNESFESITQAVITAFVYISTSENYTFMYDVLDAAYYRKHGDLMLINATFITLLFAMIGLFIFIPMIIHRFELAFEERRILSDIKNIASKENAIIAAFILLDMNGDLDIDKHEYQSLVQSSILVDKNKLNIEFDVNDSNGMDINQFVEHLLSQTFRSKIMSSTVPKQSKWRAWCECNIIRHRLYCICVLITCVMPFLMVSLLRGLANNISELSLNYVLYVLFLINMCEIHFRVIVYGCARYWDLMKYRNPNYVAAAINKYVGLTINCRKQQSIVRLTSSQRAWVTQHLSDIRPLSILEKATLTLIHRLQLVMIWGTFTTFVLSKIYFYFYYADDTQEWKEMNQRYSMYFIQLGVLIRVFFLIPVNQKLIWVIFSVFPQFLSLFAFLALFMYGYARIGCTLFGDDITDVVTEDVYPQSVAIKAKFNDLSLAMLALLQLMVGEGWHELMYFNVIATHPGAAVYFIAYITAVTIIISNVFVGLFLADIDELSTEQANDDILVNSHKTESFEKYANYRLNLLNYQIKMDRIKSEKMQNQVDQIELLLYHHKLNLVHNQKQ